MKKQKIKLIINENIRGRSVRLVGKNVPEGQTGKTIDTDKAIEFAESLEKDLILINPEAEPPVCTIEEASKFLYEKEKLEKKNKQKNKPKELKEIRFSPTTDDHDIEIKSNKANDFLEKGHKVRANLYFDKEKARFGLFKEQGEVILCKFLELISDKGVPEEYPKMNGATMSCIIRPKK
jgi:translation initiation factor IF-3